MKENSKPSIKSLQDDKTRLEKELEAVRAIQEETPKEWRIIRQESRSEVTPVVVASDWHIDEVVDPETVNDLNEFNPKIAEQRAMKFFENVVKLYEISAVKSEIHGMILALLGDFISSSLHEELMENNAMPPIEAIMEAQRFLYNGIKFLLDNTTGQITIPCSIGNHSRLQKDKRHATAAGNNLETYMYHNLANLFKDNERVRFIIGKAYHTYLQVYDKTLRFHHGDNVRYYGGVSGIYLSMNKALTQWNKAKRSDLSVNGHFHQMRDGGDFISNGSLIGYNAYAMSIKADYEKPSQTFFLIHPRYGKTIVAPIFLD